MIMYGALSEGSNNGEALDPDTFCHVERLAQECGKEAQVATLCHLPGCISGADGNHVSCTTMQELQNIQGVGAGKAKRYGKEFCKLIQNYCERK